MELSTVRAFLAKSKERLSRKGVGGLREIARDVYESIIRHGVSRVYWPKGTPIFEEPWDVLLILDACRADLLAEVEAEYDFLDTPDTRYSVASTSKEWMERNFDATYATEARRTVYITGNPYSNLVLEEADFAVLDEAWRDEWDDDLGTILPHALTDRAIATHRELDPDRMIVHYMQPHYPFVRKQSVDDGIPLDYFDVDDSEGIDRCADVWSQFKAGDLTTSEIRNLYLDNLRYVLDDISRLLDNLDAETLVVSADHGNGFGEFGIYSHPPGMPFKPIREVPWYVTAATDTEEYVPQTDRLDRNSDSPSVEERLQDLGYA